MPLHTETAPYCCKRLDVSFALALADLEALCFTQAWTETEMTAAFAQPAFHAYGLIDDSGALLAYITLYHIADELEIINIAVHPDARCRGLGGHLLDYALREEIKLGILAMFLEVRTSNTPAIKLYERAGFHLVGRRRGYYTAPVEDGLVYERRL